MLVHLDSETGEFLWCCPLCGELIGFQSQTADSLAEWGGACEGCRAKVTFERHPELIGIFLQFWARSDTWPQSVSWMEAIPPSGISILGSADQAHGTTHARHTAALGRLAS